MLQKKAIKRDRFNAFKVKKIKGKSFMKIFDCHLYQKYMAADNFPLFWKQFLLNIAQSGFYASKIIGQILQDRFIAFTVTKSWDSNLCRIVF